MQDVDPMCRLLVRFRSSPWRGQAGLPRQRPWSFGQTRPRGMWAPEAIWIWPWARAAVKTSQRATSSTTVI